jgi:thioredoxin 1
VRGKEKVKGQEMKSYFTTLNNKNFEKEVLSCSTLVLVEFGAEWCGTCYILAPIFEELKQFYNGRIKIGKLDVDQNYTLKEKYGISELPTILFFKDGEIIDFIVGAVPKQEIEAKINNLISD